MTVELVKADYRDLRDIKWIIVHHSATPSGNVKVFRRYHVEQLGYEDVAYHYVICNGNGGPDGEVQPGRPLEKVGAHAYGANRQSVGICLVGNFMQAKPTMKQWESLISLCLMLMKQYNIPLDHVIGHKEVPGIFNVAYTTDCPGNNLPPHTVRATLSKGQTDYAGHPLEGSVKQALELGILHGYPDGTFRPNQPTTRAEFAAGLVNLYNKIKGSN